jgi:hypothetical protein
MRTAAFRFHLPQSHHSAFGQTKPSRSARRTSAVGRERLQPPKSPYRRLSRPATHEPTHYPPEPSFATGVATQLDPVRVVNDAFQDGVREGGITDQVMPSFDGIWLVINVAPLP